MKIVKLNRSYKGNNSGEFCTFSDEEVDYLIDKKYGELALSVCLLKDHERHRAGTKLTLQKSAAEKLIKDGIAEPTMHLLFEQAIGQNPNAPGYREIGSRASFGASKAKEHLQSGVAREV